MNMVLSVDQNNGIGCEGALLMRIPEDMKHFKRLTLGKVVVMGRATLESLPGGRPLKDRVNIVLSRSAPAREGITVCRDLSELKTALAPFAPQDVFIIGGESVYRQLLEYSTVVYLTRILTALPADRHFPDLDALGWPREELGRSDYEGVSFIFYRYSNPGVKTL